MSEQPSPHVLTMHVINDLVTHEANPNWYFRRLGWMAEKEPVLWQWVHKVRKVDIAQLHQECSEPPFGSPFGMTPGLGPAIDKVLLRAYLRGFLLGSKFFAGMMGVPYDFDLPGDKKALPRPTLQEDRWSEELEVDAGDLEE